MALERWALGVGATLLALLVARTRQPRRRRPSARADGSDGGDGLWFDAPSGDDGAGCAAGSDGGSGGGCGDGGGGDGGGD